MSHSKGILFPKRSHFLGITRFSSFLLCMGMAAFNAGCSARNVQQSLVYAQQSLAEPGPANAETEVTDDRDAILEELVECYPCFPKTVEYKSDVFCGVSTKLIKNETYLNRFFENNQAAFDARLKTLQEKIDECVDEYVNPEQYSARSEPDCHYLLVDEYSVFRELQSEKADADWLKAHKLPDNYRLKNTKGLEFREYCGCSECRNSSGYEITNSFEFNENNEELLPDLIRSETINITKADEDGNTLMHRYGRNPAIAKALIEKGADLTLKNNEGLCAFYGIGDSFRRELILSGLDTSKVINSDGNTVLHNYANDVEMIAALIKNGADVHQKNKEGRTPIFYAQNVDAVKLLMDNGADIKAVDNHHNTLLHAVLSIEIRSLLQGLGLDIHAKNDEGQTPIFFADSADALKWYIEHGADVKTIDKHGNSLLHLKTFNPEMYGMLLNYNLDINAQNDEGQTPIFFVDMNNTDLLSAYIKAGADINARDKHGNTIVHYQFASKESWELLLQSGFNINTTNNQKEPAWFARYKQECIQSGPSWERWEVSEREEELLDAYLELGSDVNVHDEHGNTLLHRTLKCGKIDDKDIDCYDESFEFGESRIRKLIKAGIDVNARNEDGYTPIFSCISHDDGIGELNIDCFNLLKELGADIYATSNKGDNLFTECIRKGCTDYDFRGGYPLIFENQLHKNLSEKTIQRALEVYKEAVFGRDAECRWWDIYDPLADVECGFYYADLKLYPLMMDWGLDLKDGYMCILGVPEAKTDEQKQKIAAVINEKICGEGRTALNQRDQCVSCFVRAGADINTQDDDGKTPLMKNGIGFEAMDQATYDCINVDTIIWFVENGADINLRDNAGKTILNYVLDLDDTYCRDTPCSEEKECNIDIVSYLINNGADVNNRNKEGKTYLMYAAEKCEDNFVKQLIAKGADVKAKDNEGKSVLMYAAVKCEENNIELFIHKGADINAKDNKGKSVLMYAAKEDNEALIEQLIAKGADVKAKDNKGKSVLMYAVEYIHDVHEELIEQLMAEGADVNAKDNSGKSVLMYAAEIGNDKLTGLLIAKGADIHAKDNKGTSVLDYAFSVERCNNGLIKQLIDKGAVNAKDNKGRSVLMYALSAKWCNNGLIEQLIAKGADIHAKDNLGRSVLMHALADRCNIELTGQLIVNGADVNAKDDEGKSVLMYAAEYGNYKLIEQLINKGADVHAKDNKGKSVLMYVPGYSYRYVIEHLIAQGADVHAIDNTGKSLLMYAVEKGNDELIERLIAKGADINVKDNTGKSALMYAAEEGSDKLIELLIATGADVNAKDNTGKSALMYAAACQDLYDDKRKEIIKQLMAKGADLNAKDNTGKSAFMYAEENCDRYVIQELLEYVVKSCQGNYYGDLEKIKTIKQLIAKGANLNAKDNTGKSVLEYAEEKCDRVVIQELLK